MKYTWNLNSCKPHTNMGWLIWCPCLLITKAFDPLLGLLSSKTKPVASVSGQSSGCCITPTGYRAQRGGASAAQPLNLSQVRARGCCLLFGAPPIVTLWRTLLLAGSLNKAKWSPFGVTQFGVLWPASYLHVLCLFFPSQVRSGCNLQDFYQTSLIRPGRLEKYLEFRKSLRCFSPCLAPYHHMHWDRFSSFIAQVIALSLTLFTWGKRQRKAFWPLNWF